MTSSLAQISPVLQQAPRRDIICASVYSLKQFTKITNKVSIHELVCKKICLHPDGRAVHQSSLLFGTSQDIAESVTEDRLSLQGYCDNIRQEGYDVQYREIVSIS